MGFTLYDDAERFDAEVRRAAPKRVVDVLLLLIPAEVDRELEGMLPARPPGAMSWIPNVDVVALARLGRPALWLMSEWALEVLPRAQRVTPAPAHEKWDALVELHVARAETAWLVADLFAALAEHQASLGQRILLGIERRFGARGRRILAERANGSALESLLSQ